MGSIGLRYKIAIVGAGPAGYFAAQALHNLQDDTRRFSIDMFERLPTPWGLVRSGVAPDHPKMKTVSKIFEKIAAHEDFRLIANVEVGVDLSLDELKDSYDAVVIAVGTPRGKRLGIPGEDLGNVISSADFVYWYNGHPDFTDVKVDLSGTRALVIGAGNVAMDVGRMLAIDPKELDSTDTADHALKLLHESRIRDVSIMARRGAEYAAFTSPELRELPDLDSANVVINEEDIEKALQRAGNEPEKHVKSNLDAMLSIARGGSKDVSRTLRFLFEHSPISINGDLVVRSMTFKTPSGPTEIDCDLVVTAIGYAPTEMLGLHISKGRYENEDGYIAENLYVVGWAKRGPSGVIGTNKSDAAEVMRLLTERLKSAKVREDILPNLLSRGVHVVSQDAWNLINEEEMRRGVDQGRPRIKFTEIDAMLAVVDESE